MSLTAAAADSRICCRAWVDMHRLSVHAHVHNSCLWGAPLEEVLAASWQTSSPPPLRQASHLQALARVRLCRECVLLQLRDTGTRAPSVSVCVALHLQFCDGGAQLLGSRLRAGLRAGSCTEQPGACPALDRDQPESAVFITATDPELL